MPKKCRWPGGDDRGRLTEILKTARFHPLSDWTVAWEGQLKQKAERMLPDEIPTLVEAEVVIGAGLRLRGLLSCEERVVVKRTRYQMAPIFNKGDQLVSNCFNNNKVQEKKRICSI